MSEQEVGPIAEVEPYSAFATVYNAAGFPTFSQNMIGIIQGLLARHRAAPRRMLDLACGTGAAAVAFARLGYEVVGVDRSDAMLAQARQLADGLPVTLVRQDMRELALDVSVDAAFCLFDSLNYLLETGDLVRTFHGVREALAPGGLFLFDMNTRAGLAQRWAESHRVQFDRDDLFLAAHTAYDPETHLATDTLTGFVLDGESGLYRRFREVHVERGYGLAEIDAALAESGLEVVERQGLAPDAPGGPLRLTDLTPATGRVLYLARRSA
ncbi:MAG: class I SAM-dependent methyltransferase [Chloroflexi bacterium]|nr:class I SAM-dependent methyltransferase [Chloroflexota bacterium]